MTATRRAVPAALELLTAGCVRWEADAEVEISRRFPGESCEDQPRGSGRERSRLGPSEELAGDAVLAAAAGRLKLGCPFSVVSPWRRAEPLSRTGGPGMDGWPCVRPLCSDGSVPMRADICQRPEPSACGSRGRSPPLRDGNRAGPAQRPPPASSRKDRAWKKSSLISSETGIREERKNDLKAFQSITQFYIGGALSRIDPLPSAPEPLA